MKKLLFILNPCAGTKKANKVLPELLALFNRANYDVLTYVTGARGEAIDEVAQKAGNVDMIVCCGGDGTFNETVSGLLKDTNCLGAEPCADNSRNVPVGYIPTGSTNDFAGSLGLPLEPLKAAKQILDGAPQKYDVGSFNGRYFTYVASFGAFTRSSYATPQNVKNALGHTAYVLSGISDLMQIRSIPVRMELDGSEVIEGDYVFGAICNSTSIGGVMKLNPSQVDMSDGLFEILLIRAPKDLGELTECLGAIQKQQYEGCRMITFRSAKTIKVTASPELAWTLDGEMETGHSEILVQNHQHAITLVK